MTKLMMFYNNITPLSRETHKKWKFKATTDYAFAKDVHLTPLAGSEFAIASRNYPIVFASNKDDQNKENFFPVAILSLIESKNFFVDAANRWLENAYIPAFIRRYPFMLAGKADAEELSVCVDTESKMFNEFLGTELFNDDGSVSPFLEDRIRFLNGFKGEMERTQQFVTKLVDSELLVKKTLEVTSANGQNARLQDFWMVDEEKFNKMNGDQLVKFHRKGFLSWIVIHLLSLNNLPPLLNNQMKNQPIAAPKADKTETH